MLETLVDTTIKRYNLISLGDRVGVAVSGGVDSMVLLNVLYTLSRRSGFYVCALHFEHGIRSEESVGDMHFVEQQCEAMHIPFYAGSADVPVIAAQTGENLEAAARRLRYEFFEERKQQLGLAKIAIAHHKDDFAETFLLNLLRGSGVAGLTSMKYQRQPGIIRPLLDISRKQIEAYAKKHEIPFRVDSTNAALKYTRNYIRAEILPRMAKLNPEVSSAIMRASEILGEEDAALFEYAKSEYHKISRREEGQIVLDLIAFNALPKAIRRRVVRMALLEFTTLQDVDKRALAGRVFPDAAGGAAEPAAQVPLGLQHGAVCGCGGAGRRGFAHQSPGRLFLSLWHGGQKEAQRLDDRRKNSPGSPGEYAASGKGQRDFVDRRVCAFGARQSAPG